MDAEEEGRPWQRGRAGPGVAVCAAKSDSRGATSGAATHGSMATARRQATKEHAAAAAAREANRGEEGRGSRTVVHARAHVAAAASIRGAEQAGALARLATSVGASGDGRRRRLGVRGLGRGRRGPTRVAAGSEGWSSKRQQQLARSAASIRDRGQQWRHAAHRTTATAAGEQGTTHSGAGARGHGRMQRVWDPGVVTTAGLLWNAGELSV